MRLILWSANQMVVIQGRHSQRTENRNKTKMLILLIWFSCWLTPICHGCSFNNAIDFWNLSYAVLLFSIILRSSKRISGYKKHGEIVTPLIAEILTWQEMLPFGLVCLLTVLSGAMSGCQQQLELLLSLYFCPSSVHSIYLSSQLSS